MHKLSACDAQSARDSRQHAAHLESVIEATREDTRAVAAHGEQEVARLVGEVAQRENMIEHTRQHAAEHAVQLQDQVCAARVLISAPPHAFASCPRLVVLLGLSSEARNASQSRRSTRSRGS